jgi:hypothetical protein
VRRVRLLPLILVAVLAAGALGARAAPPTDECNGIQECQRAQGPWVVVPAHGWAQYLLECPRRRGIAGGVAAVASSSDVHVMWQAELGAPVAPGRSTSRYVFLRAVSARHRAGLFQPRIGCIPVSTTRSTYSVRVTIPGAPLSYAATTLKLRPGTTGSTTLGCIPGQRLVDSWTAVAFRSTAPPRVALAQGIQVARTLVGTKVSISIAVSEAFPPRTGAEVQLGVMCAQS